MAGPAEDDSRRVQPSVWRRRSALRSGALTGGATIVVAGAAALAGAYLSHRFGRTAETDGFLTAYAFYIVLGLAAQSFRQVVVPDLTRALSDDRLGSEVRGYAVAFLALAVPAIVLVALFAHPIAGAVTAQPDAEEIAARALRWLIPAAFGQLFAALCASALAARDSYGVAAVAYACGGVAGLLVFVTLAPAHGLVALAWGLAVNALVTLAIPLATLLVRGDLSDGGRVPLDVGARIWRLVEGSALPTAMQSLYLIGLLLAKSLGVGQQTSFSYAFLFAGTLVSATAFALGVISSAPLTRRGVDAKAIADHVVHSSWVSLALTGAAAGVFAVVGGRIAGLVLGGAYTGDVGREFGRLVVELAPWMVVSTAFSITFPLVFVLGRRRLLVPLALGGPLLDLPLALLLRHAFGLEGIAISLAIVTFAVDVVLLGWLSRGALVAALLGVGRLALLVAALAVVAFAPAALVLPSVAAAAVGLVLYFGLLATLRRLGLSDAFTYVRGLH